MISLQDRILIFRLKLFLPKHRAIIQNKKIENLSTVYMEMCPLLVRDREIERERKR